MNFPLFQKALSQSTSTLPVATLATAALWMLFVPSGATGVGESGNLFWQMVKWPSFDPRFYRTAAFLLLLVSGYWQTEVSNRYALLNVRSKMPAVCFVCMSALCVFLRDLHPALVLMALHGAVLYLLFSVTVKPHTTLQVFKLFGLVSIETLVYPQAWVLVVAYGACLAYMRFSSMKVFFAALIGLIVPYWFFFSLTVLIDRQDIFLQQTESMCLFGWPDFSCWSSTQVIAFAFSSFLFLVSSFHHFRHQRQEKPRVKMLNNCLCILGYVSLCFVLCCPQDLVQILPLCIVPFAMMAGIYFAHGDSRGSNVLTMVSVIVWVALAVLSVCL